MRHQTWLLPFACAALFVAGCCKTPPPRITPRAKALPRCPPARRCAATPSGWELVEILVAKKDIAPGTILSEDLITTAKMPRKFRSSDMLIPKELQTALGTELVRPILKGEPLAWSHLLTKESGSTRFSEVIAKQGRAVAIRVDETTAVARLIRPTDHVDVIWVHRDARTKQLRAQVLMQNLIVLATGRRQPRHKWARKPRYRTITLLVLPTEAASLALARATGKLTLALRNPEDAGTRAAPLLVTTKVLAAGKLTAKQLQERKRTIQRVRTIRGLPRLKP